MTTRTQLRAGLIAANHNDAMRVRTALKAGGENLNHSEALRVRTTVRAGTHGQDLNHNEVLRQTREQGSVSMRRQPLTTVRKGDRLELLVARAGLRAGLRRSRPRR